MSLPLIALSRLAEDAAHHVTAAKILAPFAPEASAQHIKNFRTIHQQIGEALAAHDRAAERAKAEPEEDNRRLDEIRCGLREEDLP
jgi:hypothetical protein